MGVELKSGLDGTIATIGAISKGLWIELRDAAGNALAQLKGAKLPDDYGYQVIAGTNDGFATPLRTDRLGNLLMGNTVNALFTSYEGTTIDTQKWAATVATFVPAQTTANGLSVNPTNILTANANALYISQKQFQIAMRMPLQFKARARVSLFANSVAELGFGQPSGVVAMVSNGAFWRATSANSMVPVLAFNGTEITGDPVDISAYTSAFLTYDVILDDAGAHFTIHETASDVLLSEQALSVPSGWPLAMAVTHVPCFHRLYNGPTGPASPAVMVMGGLSVLMHDTYVAKPWSDISAQNGYTSDINPTSFAQLANYANTAAPASGTMSNTAAAYTTLGGQFQWVALAGAETDYALFAFTVPTGYQLFVKRIRIELFNMGAANAATPTLTQWGVGRNGASANLSTGAFIRKTLGVIRILASAVIGDRGDNVIDVTFDTPLLTESGRVFAVIVKIPVGAATASQIIRGVVDIDGRFE